MTTHRPPPRRPADPPPPEGPKGLPPGEARELVVSAEARLWSDAGAEVRDYLIVERRLTEATIRAARLGWAPRVELMTADEKYFTARGIVIPWFDADRLALVKIRQPGETRPKYAEAFRDRPRYLAGGLLADTGSPLVVVEGEFDALLLAQELVGLASLITLGPASIRPETETLNRFLPFSPWYIASDDDEAGDRAAITWPRSSRRVRPPGSFKDWTEAAQGGINLRRWWTDRLAGVESPELFTWPELSARRWGGADETPGIVSPSDGWREDLARWPFDLWLAWHRRTNELTPAGAKLEAIQAAQRQAHDELTEHRDDHLNDQHPKAR